MPTTKKLSLLLFAFACVWITPFACKKTTTVSCDATRSLHAQSKFSIGVAFQLGLYENNLDYARLADQQFNSFTPENAFKAENLHPIENIFEWTEADRLLVIAFRNNKTVHGHTLIWHQQNPTWLSSFQGNSDAWEALFKNHIQTIVTHFKGKVKAWDVVNEAFNEDGTLRNSIWKEKIGPTYLEKAFRYAQAADPQAALFYNDYNLESNPLKRKQVLSYLNQLRNRGVKISGIGLQMHVSLQYPELTQIAAAFKEVADQDYQVHVSELDIAVNLLGNNNNPDAAVFEAQADCLGKIVTLYKQIPQKYQYGITFWGVRDNDSWIPAYFNRQDYPLLFDKNYLPKPAYCKLMELL
jgi:endo-1,4-beta-xylanase